MRPRFLLLGSYYLDVAHENGLAGQGRLEIVSGRVGRSQIQVR